MPSIEIVSINDISRFDIYKDRIQNAKTIAEFEPIKIDYKKLSKYLRFHVDQEIKDGGQKTTQRVLFESCTKNHFKQLDIDELDNKVNTRVCPKSGFENFSVKNQYTNTLDRINFAVKIRACDKK